MDLRHERRNVIVGMPPKRVARCNAALDEIRETQPVPEHHRILFWSKHAVAG